MKIILIIMMKKFISLILFSVVLLSANVNAEVVPAPDLKLPTVNGTVQLSELKGDVVYLDFWASWCLPCKKSFPWMERMQQRYGKQGFKIVAVNLDKDKALADEFLKQKNVSFTVAFDASGSSASTYKLRGMPSSYLIGRDGKVHASHIGFRDKDKDKLEQAVKNLLNK
jgi:thiol-disulfide isomerase/thioredoxin